MSEKPAIFTLLHSQSLSEMNNKKRIVINGDVKMGTVTVYSEYVVVDQVDVNLYVKSEKYKKRIDN